MHIFFYFLLSWLICYSTERHIYVYSKFTRYRFQARVSIHLLILFNFSSRSRYSGATVYSEHSNVQIYWWPVWPSHWSATGRRARKYSDRYLLALDRSWCNGSHRSCFVLCRSVQADYVTNRHYGNSCLCNITFLRTVVHFLILSRDCR